MQVDIKPVIAAKKGYYNLLWKEYWEAIGVTGAFLGSVALSVSIGAAGASYVRNAKTVPPWFPVLPIAGLVASGSLSAALALKAIAEWSDVSHVMSREYRQSFRAQRELQIPGPVIGHPVAEDPLAEPVPPVVPVTPGNPAESLGRLLGPAIICGTPGAGKGVLTSHAIAQAKRYHPDLRVVVVDPKGSPVEKAYWSGADHLWSRKVRDWPAEEIEAWLWEGIRMFQGLPEPKLLVLDEVTAMTASLRILGSKNLGRFQGFLASVGSMGDADGCHLWLLAQSPHVADLGLSGGTRSVFRPVAVVSSGNRMAVEAMASTTFIPRLSNGALEDLLEASPCQRAVYDGSVGQWAPMARLGIPGGYNRDRRGWEPGSQPLEPADQHRVLTEPPEPFLRSQATRKEPEVLEDPLTTISTGAKKVLGYLWKLDNPVELPALKKRLSGGGYRMKAGEVSEAVDELKAARLAQDVCGDGISPL